MNLLFRELGGSLIIFFISLGRKRSNSSILRENELIVRHGGNSYYDHRGNSGGRRPQARTSAHIGLSLCCVYKLYLCVWYVCLCMCVT